MSNTSEADPTHELQSGAVVVKAWAPWCGSCRTLSPLVDQVATDAPGVALVGIKVDSEPELVDQFGVRSVPTLIALHDGVEVGRLNGLQSEEALRFLFRAAAGDSTAPRGRPPGALVAARAATGVAVTGAGAVFASLALVVIGTLLVVWAALGLIPRRAP